MAQTSHTVSVGIGGGNTHSGNILSSFNSTFCGSNKDAQIMRWLSPLEPSNRHQGVRNERFDGVGNWLLETSEFREWRKGGGGADKAVLFCSGNPGVGKTYLSSLVIDSLCDQARQGDTAVAGLYYDFLARQDQTITNMLGAILKQLVGRGGVPEYLREAFQKAKREFGGRGPLLADLMGMLRVAISSLPQVFICIDALDECLPKYLPDLLESLRDIVRESPRVRIFLTGRPHVRDHIQRYFPKAVVIPISPNTDDIRNYVEMRLDRDYELEAMNDDLRADIVRTILDKMSDTFLLVSLSIEAILGEVTIRRRRKKLEEMTRGNGVRDAYTTTLTRLKAQKGHISILGLKVLMWVLYSERPLRADELRHALGVEVGSSDLDLDNVPALRTPLASCLGLVTVEASSSTVRLVHFTLREYLLSDPTLFHSPHSTIAEVCLTYLNFKHIRDLSPTLNSAPSAMPLLEYASCYWGKHARREMTESVKILALRLLDTFDEHIAAQLMLLGHNEDGGLGPNFDGIGGPRGFTGLHGAAFLGIVEIVAAVLELKEWDVNASDSMGFTAIAWAARRGHEEVVKILLERGDVNPDKPNMYGQTPLFCAASNGHEGVVKTLLGRDDVNPNKPANYGQTPLYCAASNGHEVVVRTLLGRDDVSPDELNKYGQTLLCRAASNGYEGVVKMLLEREDVNPDKPGEDGQTPLYRATSNGHEGVVKMLLEREDVNPNEPGEDGQTPLYRAASNGYEGVVKMLLEREDVNPDKPGEDGQAPLYRAISNGHEGVVKMLLEREDVNPDEPGEDGQTPLYRATSNGYEGVVKMLLQRGGVDPNKPNKYGQTPLFSAAQDGHEKLVKILLEREDINPNKPDNRGQTPLYCAARTGHEGVVKVLLGRGDVNPDKPDVYDQTPLFGAASNGHEGAVGVLLGRDDVNPDKPNKYGQTPLFGAAWGGHEGVVKILLRHDEVNPDKSDKSGRTPLWWAAKSGHAGVVALLRPLSSTTSSTS